MIDTFFWNVRGINDISKHSPLVSWINLRKLSFGALLETHIREAIISTVLASLGSDWRLVSNYQYSDLRKIWFIYKDPIKVQVLYSDAQSITLQIFDDTGISFFFTAVYASNELDDRKNLWTSLKDTEISFRLDEKTWLVCGDFNEIIDPRESSNTSLISSTAPMREFAAALSSMGLFDLSYQGPPFTWSNHRPSDPLGKRLDRCLINDQWQTVFPSSHCTFEPPEFSDHTPCHIRLLSTKPSFGSKPFMFQSFIANLPSFVPTIQSIWEGFLSRTNNLSSLSFRLKGLKRPIKTLAKDNLSNIERRVLEAKDSLISIQLSALTNPSKIIFEMEKNTKDYWEFLRLAEECFFRQRSRIKWLQLGDLNTAFFHRITLVRNASNAIKYLLRADGSRSETLEEVHKIALEFFSGILCNVRGSYCPYLPDIICRIIRVVCSNTQQSLLAAPISRDLVKTTLFKLSLNRTPGPDGWTAEFFRATWLIIGAEVTDAVMDFFAKPFMPSALNATTLILIPKRPRAENIAEYRPISCLNTIYKLVTKIISSRLKKVLPTIILPNQTGFVENRLILENILLASEVLNGYHKKVSLLGSH